ncbi:Protein BZZ1 [Coemansia sp. RSA 1286]|nr:Protein BZZ1 [Coemansia sp. RSA 1286]
MTFGSELKPNEFGAINGHVEKQLEIYGGLGKLLAEKAAAEKEYGRKLLDLSRGFQTQLAGIYESKEGTGINSLALTEAEASSNTPLELLPAANEWAMNLEEEGRLHVQLASKVSGDIADELVQAFDTLSDTRKHTLEFYQRLLAERDRIFEQKDKARAGYEAKAKVLMQSQQKQERATTEKDQDKHRQKAEKDSSSRNQAKNEYILQVAVANSVKQAINHRFTPRIMDSMQTIDEQRVNATKRLLQQMLAMQETANVQLVNGTQRTAHIVGRIAAEVDSAQFVRRRLESGASSWDEQPDFRVVVDLASGDNENMMLDGESQTILRNTCIQAQKNTMKAEADAREKHMAADQSRQRAQTTTKGVERELENATTAEREATMAELEAVQYHALSDAIEQRLGHVDAGTPHEFKAFTVAISKICDYCGESIGGLNRKAGKCAQCEYTCHAKCQIKVEPNCPGRDPEAKSGFLSMFGTRRGTKKGKGERQRSQSTASVGSGASVDMTPPQPPPRTLTQQQPQQQQQQQQIGMHLSSSANASTASHSASQTSLPPRSSLSYGGGFGAATMPRTSASPLIEPSALAGAIASRTATINRVPTMTPLIPVSDTHDSATQVPVLYDFEGDGNTTLTVRAGDRVTVVAADEDGSGWTEVIVNGSQQQGLVPTSYVDMSEYRAPPRVPENRALMPPMAEMAVARDEYVVALYDFAGRDAEELSVREGDRIRVVSRDIGEGWIQGALNSHEGRLPVSYVRNE